MADQRPFLPYGRQSIDDDDIEAVADVLCSDFLTTGPVVEAFEAKLAEVTGAAHAISVSSGTAALHLAGVALDLEPDDLVVVPSMTFLASANTAIYGGAEVQFADVDPRTGLLTADTLTQALARAGNRAKAVVPVHINGQTADMAAIGEVASRTGLAVIEDACHALGGSQARADGTLTPIGSCPHSLMSVFSFHPVKTIAMGEGGAITTNDPNVAARLRILRNIGMTRDPTAFQLPEQAFAADGTPNPWYYEMPVLGFNYRASAIHCGLGLSQLKKLNQFVEKRARLLAHYHDKLAPLAPMVEPLAAVPGGRPAWHLAVVRIDFAQAGISRAEVMRALHARSIGTQVHYIPVHRQPFYRQRYGDLHLPGADAYYERILTLPLFESMESDDVDYVVTQLAAVLGTAP
jgi:UDP-4-amino-4,6-dideoxy-N-acetyl-beta-L-altrosamine transaminase